MNYCDICIEVILLKTALRYTAEKNIDAATGCRAHFVYGSEDIYIPHCHDYFEIFIVAKGTITHMVNGRIYHFPEGSLVFIRPDDVHTNIYNDPESVDISFINIAFTRDTAKLLFTYLFDEETVNKLITCDIPPHIILDKSNRKSIVAQINELNSENRKDSEAIKMHTRVILANVFPYFVNPKSYDTKTKMPSWLCELNQKMKKPENFSMGIEQMVILSGKSREHICRSFKKYYSITVTDYINDLKINYASNLLINTNKPIIDICFECGFQSMSYFYRVFRQKNGKSPKVFRDFHR